MGIVELKDVCVDFEATRALDSISLEIRKGELLSIIGSNGAGKTTALRVIAGLQPLSSGEVLFNDELVTGSNIEQMRKQVTLVFQRLTLFSTTVCKNAASGLRVRGIDQAEVESRVTKALEIVELTDLRDRLARKLSGGEQRRLNLAMAMVLKPTVLLLDEPTVHLDPENTQIVGRLLQTLNKRSDMTIVLSTHNILQAQLMGDRIAVIHRGRLEKIGSARDVFRAELDSIIGQEMTSNVFSGHAKVVDDGTKRRQLVRITLENDVGVEAISDIEGPVTVTIPSEDIVLSRDTVLSSARNILKGTIQEISIEGAAVFVTVDVGLPLTAQITRSSLERLDMKQGDSVYATFKATSVRTY
ncbi:MAG: ABC transporter ATP-binding protein [Candidatus Thorarchaeota archaeon]|nr:MAG: ABC transporter ATP-binding protein [Candidatus Thorarchaeota archaeon]